MHLVHRIVAHFVRRLPRSVQREDLIAAGTLGLFYALRSSAHTCDEMFASYARIRIRGAIIDELRRHDWAPRRRKPVALRVVGPDGVTRAPELTQGTENDGRAQAPVVVAFDDLPPQLSVALGTEEVSPLEQMEEKCVVEALHDAVNLLPPRERSIIRMRYFDGLPSKAIASSLGLSEARISQLHARATARLKEILAETGNELELAA